MFALCKLLLDQVGIWVFSDEMFAIEAAQVGTWIYCKRSDLAVFGYNSFLFDE